MPGQAERLVPTFKPTTLCISALGLQNRMVTIDNLDIAQASRTAIARQVSLVPQEHVDIFPFRVLSVVVMLSKGRIMAADKANEVMTAETVSRLYQTPTRRVVTDTGQALFIPEPTEVETVSTWT